MSAFTQKMGRLRTRAGVLVGASAAVFAIAGVSASSAGATTTAPTCPGTGATSQVHIKGMGSSLQKVAQEIWTGREVTTVTEPATIPLEGTANAFANSYRSKCTGTKPPTVTYGSSGSGKGLGAFGYTGTLNVDSGNLAFVGTDDGPNREQIESAETAIGGSIKPVILPVTQTAIAVMIHPPTACALTENKITWLELNKVFGGKTITKWSQFSNVANKANCEAKEKEEKEAGEKAAKEKA
jgi:hypothetical protein